MERPYQQQTHKAGFLCGQLQEVVGQRAAGGCQNEVPDQKQSCQYTSIIGSPTTSDIDDPETVVCIYNSQENNGEYSLIAVEL